LKAAEPTRCPDTSTAHGIASAAGDASSTIAGMKRLIMVLAFVGLAVLAVRKLQSS